MELRRLYNWSGKSPAALDAARKEVARLEARLKAASGADALKAAAAELATAKAALAAATPPVDGISVLSTGASPQQHFSKELISTGQRQGWLVRRTDPVHGEVIVIRSQEEEGPADEPEKRTRSSVREYLYKVLLEPGTYCLHCGVELEDASPLVGEDGLTDGRRHVLDFHHAEQMAFEAALGDTTGRDRWNAAYEYAKSIGRTGQAAIDFANNLGGYRTIHHVEAVLVSGGEG